MKSVLKLFFILFLFNGPSIIIASEPQVIQDNNDDDNDANDVFVDPNPDLSDKVNASSSDINLSGTSDHSGSLNVSPSSSNSGSAINLNDITAVSVTDVTDDEDEDSVLGDADDRSGNDSSSSSLSSGSNSPSDVAAAKLSGQSPTNVGGSSTNSGDYVNYEQPATAKVGAQNNENLFGGNSAEAKYSDTLNYDQPAIIGNGSTIGADTSANSGNSSNSTDTTQAQNEAEYAKNTGNSFLNKIKEGLLAKPYLTGLGIAAAISTIVYKYNSNVRKKVDNALKTVKDKVQKVYAQYANKPFKVSTALKIGAVGGLGYIGYNYFGPSGLKGACCSMWGGFWDRDLKEKLLIVSSIGATCVSAVLIRNAIKNRNKNKEKAA